MSSSNELVVLVFWSSAPPERREKENCDILFSYTLMLYADRLRRKVLQTANALRVVEQRILHF